MEIISSQEARKYIISRSIEVLEKGGVILYPTDTVYAIGCLLSNRKGIERIYKLKKMPTQKPLSILCSSLNEVSHYAHMSNEAFRVMKRLTPGPYTFILQAAKSVPKVMLSKQKTVGIRIPNSELILSITQSLSEALVTTSARLDGEELFGNIDDITQSFSRVDLAIHDGDHNSDPSTILDFSGSQAQLVRQGKGSIDEVLSHL